MLNFIWTREPSEAYLNPYEYDAQQEFSRDYQEKLCGGLLKVETIQAIWDKNIEANPE